MDVSPDTIEINDPQLLQPIARDAPVGRLCTGFRFSEGPIWNPREQCLYFSDMPNDIHRRWSANEGVVEVRNLNWGGPDWNDLYCACSTSVYRVRMLVRGNPVAYMQMA